MSQTKQLLESLTINVLDYDWDDEEYRFKKWIEEEWEKSVKENPDSVIVKQD